MPSGAERFAREALGVAAQQDVHTATGHVGGDGDRARLPGLGDDHGLALVLLGVQHLMRNTLPLQRLREHLGGLDGQGAHEHRLAPGHDRP